MNKELTCQQISALLNFYIEGKLTPKLCEYIEQHLENCPKCRAKVEELKGIFKNLDKNKDKNIETKKSSIPKYIGKLSAYVDNELDIEDNIKIKKMTISNPEARKELELMYKFKKMLSNAYQKTKNESKFDYSKLIVNQIQETDTYTTNYFYKLAVIFFILLGCIISGFIYLYF